MLFICEGESDCWALWFHGHAALGVPGAGNYKLVQSAHLTGVRRVNLLQDSDQAGEDFVRNMAVRLRSFGVES